MCWQDVKVLLRSKLPESVYTLWIEPIQCSRQEENALELVGPDRFFCSWVAENYLPAIKESLKELGREGVEIRFASTPEKSMQLPAPDGRGEQLRLPSMPEGKSRVRFLHPRYTFEEFMVGESNALAFSACEAVANNGSDVGPCVYLSSSTGLGKSHLTHAVAHHILNHFPSTRLHYLTSQQLTAELVRHIKNNTMEHFKEKYYRHCDLLLVEDVQSLAGKVKTQAELAQVLDVLMDSGKRVVFTGACPPKDLAQVDDGVKSRMASGLVATINPPDFKTRRLIIRRKARYHKLKLEDEVVDFLAEHVQGDIRKVESAIVNLKAKASLVKAQPSLEMAREVVAHLVERAPLLSAAVIRDFVAAQFKVSVDDLVSKSRKRSVAFPRQVSMYLARKLTDAALAEIGKTFNRDHSTVLHSIRVINEAMARNGSVRGQVEHLAERLRKKYTD